MSGVKQLYSAIISFNIFIFIMFILQNIENLHNIPFLNPFSGKTFTISLYVMVGVMVALVSIITLAGVNVMGSGLNEESTYSLKKIVFIIIQLVLYITPLTFYFLPLGLFGTTIILADLIIIIVFKFITFSSEGSEEV